MKKYLTFSEKTSLVDSIVEQSVVDGKLDVMQREIAYVLYVYQAYLGEELDFDESGAHGYYDNLVENSVIIEFYKNIPGNELRLVKRLVEEAIQEKLRQSGTITALFSKLGEIDVDSTIEKFKELDINKMKEISNLVDINNGMK